MRRTTGLGAAALAVAMVWAWPMAEADACGGTFCDAAPQGPQGMLSMPVDQTGETIVFVVDDDTVEAHIQIQYDPDTDADKFAWIVPVLALPEVKVGSEQLFLNVQNATVPSYGFQTSQEFCGGGGGGGGGWDECTAGGSSDGDATGGGDGTTGESTGGGTEVVAQASVGALDYVVLQSTSAQELTTWLGDNGFQQDPVAEPILQEYVDEGAMFVAFRLTQGADTSEIHPITIRYAGNEPCVPIRLTRIAAQEDMDIRVFFFGDARVVPTNFRHVTVNPLRLDWLQFAPNYKAAVTMAIDSPEADGHAFVTEFSGESSVVSAGDLRRPQWQSEPFATLTPSETIVELASQGFGGCNVSGECQWEHPLIRGILSAFLPVPEGIDEAAFYDCLECYDGLIDMDAWDPVGFSAAIQERVVDPGDRAVEILATYPWLTRMYTTMSPHEMTADPMFHENPDLQRVDLRNTTAEINYPCSGRSSMDVGAYTLLSWDFFNWPVFDDRMPWAERVETIPPFGAPMTLVDNTETIDSLVTEWNAQSQAGAVTPRSHDPCGGGHSSDTEGDTWDPDGDGNPGIAGEDEEASCACTAGERGGALGFWALVLLGAVVRRR